MAETGVLLVLCTFPSREEACQIGTLLVEKQLAACVNVSADLLSIYRWKGKVCQETEVQGLFKVAESRFEEFASALRERHPYEMPDILALPVVEGDPAYLAWVQKGG